MSNELSFRKHYDFELDCIQFENLVGVSDRDLHYKLDSIVHFNFFKFDKLTEKATFSINGFSGVLDCKAGKVKCIALDQKINAADVFNMFGENFIPSDIAAKSSLSSDDVVAIKDVNTAIKEAKLCYLGHQLERCCSVYEKFNDACIRLISSGKFAEEKMNENIFRNYAAPGCIGVSLFANYNILEDNICTSEFKEAFRAYVDAAQDWVDSSKKLTVELDKIRDIIQDKYLHFDSFDKDLLFLNLCNVDAKSSEVFPIMSEESLNGHFRCRQGCIFKEMNVQSYFEKFKENIAEMKRECLDGSVFISDNIVESNMTKDMKNLYSENEMSKMCCALLNKDSYDSGCLKLVQNVIANAVNEGFGTTGVFSSMIGQQIFCKSYLNVAAAEKMSITANDVNKNVENIYRLSLLTTFCTYPKNDQKEFKAAVLDVKELNTENLVPIYNDVYCETAKEDFKTIKVLYNYDIIKELGCSKNEGPFRDRSIPENSLKYSSGLGKNIYDRLQDVILKKHDSYRDLANDLMAIVSDLFVPDKNAVTADVYSKMCASVAAVTRPLSSSSYIRNCAFMSVAENCDVPEFQKAKDEFLKKEGPRFNQLKRCFALNEIIKDTPLSPVDIKEAKKICMKVTNSPVIDVDSLIKKIADCVIGDTIPLNLESYAVSCRKVAYISCMVLDDKVLYKDMPYSPKSREESLDMCKSICLKSSVATVNSFNEKIRQQEREVQGRGTENKKGYSIGD